jgi:DNA-directed RNA polymerase subunit RPC12/RpoP
MMGKCLRCGRRYQQMSTDPKYKFLCKTCAAGQANRDRIANDET